MDEKEVPRRQTAVNVVARRRVRVPLTEVLLRLESRRDHLRVAAWDSEIAGSDRDARAMRRCADELDRLHSDLLEAYAPEVAA